MTVLIVDDDIPTTQVIASSIRWGAYGINNIYTAYNIESAKRQIEEKSPQLILCDIEMPQGSGLELLEWVREKKCTCEFIILTCHENFDYAAKAIQYYVTGYITKPFEIYKTEAVIAKAVSNIVKREQQEQSSEYGEYWADNKGLLEESFWRDLLFCVISSAGDVIQAEIRNRHLDFDVTTSYRVAVCAVMEAQADENRWDSDSFRYAFRNLTAELLLGVLCVTKVFTYQRPGRYYAVIMLDGNLSDEVIEARCKSLADVCKIHLNCDVTSYVSDSCLMGQLAELRQLAEAADAKNIAQRGRMFFMRCMEDIKEAAFAYTLDAKLVQEKLRDKQGADIVNYLRRDLQRLSSENKLDYLTFHSIRQDFMQIVYDFLTKHSIQAHEVFSNAASQKLAQAAELSIFEMLKWASYIVTRTLECISAVQQTETVVEKVRRYICEHYTEELTREQIAAAVYLTPDYLSRIFKSETGAYIKDYINELRIDKAKDLLINGTSNISEIASAVGFDNFSYFSTLFKKYVGMSPREFKITSKNAK